MDGREHAKRLADLLAVARRDERLAQVRQVLLVSDLVDVYDSTADSTLPGAEGLIPSGSDGTPLVAEFLAAELGPIVQESIPSTWNLIHDVVNMRERHPHLWAATLALRVPVWQARKVAGACAELGLEGALWVDARLEADWGHLAWGRVQRKLRGLVMAADHELARARAQARKNDRFVRVTHEGDGASLVVARLDTRDALALQDAVRAIAHSLVTEGAAEPLPVLQARALGMLVTPSDNGSLPRQAATLVVHVARETLNDPSSGVARADDVGPLLLEQVTDLLRGRHVRLLPVIDLAGDPGADSYEIPAHVARQVRIRDAFSVFPFSNSRTGDLDHTATFTKQGPRRQSRASNLAPLGRREHRPKTHGGFRMTQPAPGIVEWETPLGYHYRVRHGRSRRITAAEALPHDPTGRCHFYPPPEHGLTYRPRE